MPGTPLGGRNTVAMDDMAADDTNAVTGTIEMEAPTACGGALRGTSTEGVDPSSPPSTPAYRGLPLISPHSTPVVHLGPWSLRSRPHSHAGEPLTRPVSAVTTCAPARRSVREVGLPATFSPLRVTPTGGTVSGRRRRICHCRRLDDSGLLTIGRGARRHTVERLRRGSAWRAACRNVRAAGAVAPVVAALRRGAPAVWATRQYASLSSKWWGPRAPRLAPR